LKPPARVSRPTIPAADAQDSIGLIINVITPCLIWIKPQFW
jgi:hypothetical protein